MGAWRWRSRERLVIRARETFIVDFLSSGKSFNHAGFHRWPLNLWLQCFDSIFISILRIYQSHMKWLVLLLLKNEKAPKSPSFLKLPALEVLKLVTLGKSTASQNQLKPRKDTGSWYYYKCVCIHWDEIIPTGRCWRKRIPTRGRKNAKRKILYTQKQVPLRKKIHALPKIEVSSLKYNALSFSSLTGDVKQKYILRPFVASFAMKQRAIFQNPTLFGYVQSVEKLEGSRLQADNAWPWRHIEKPRGTSLACTI